MKHILLFVFTITIFTSSAQTIYSDFVDGSIFFKLSDGAELQYLPDGKVDLSVFYFLDGFDQEYKIREVAQPFYSTDSPRLKRTFRLYFTQYAKVDHLVRELENLEIIEYAEKIPIAKVNGSMNDPKFVNGSQYYLNLINAERAWDFSKGSKDVIIAVIDDGFDMNHVDLKDNIWRNSGEIPGDGKDNDGNKFIDDITGWDFGGNDNDPGPSSTTGSSHGSHVAGIACAVSNNKRGIASIGGNLTLMTLKASVNPGSLDIGAGAAAIAYAADNGAQVINASHGRPTFSQAEKDAVDYAYGKGVLFVSTAANNSNEVKVYPGGLDKAICVANTDENDLKYSSSCWGSWVDVSAPGTAMISCDVGNNYVLADGTSQAAPLVAGLCGLMLSLNPQLTVEQLRECITTTALNIDSKNPSYAGKLGSGRIDAAKAMECAASKIGNFTTDAAVETILSPSESLCTDQFSPVISLHNRGAQTLTSAMITYQIDGGELHTYKWTGNLSHYTREEVALPALHVNPGIHKLMVTVSQPNGQADGNVSNNKAETTFNGSSSTPGKALPFQEGFDASVFPPSGWQVIDIDKIKSWQRTTLAKIGTSGAAAFVNDYNYDANAQIDELVTPALDFTGVLDLSFYVAHALYEKGDPSLEVLVSTDCGQSFTSVYKKIGSNLSTAPPTGDKEFKPTSAQWRKETVSMKQFSGSKNVHVMFRFQQDYENNIFLDNISISANPTLISNMMEDAHVGIFPNPSNGIFTIKGVDGQLQIFNLTGEMVKEFQISGDMHVNLSEYPAGVYIVKIVGKDIALTRKLTISK